jgi:hypothetical protein
MRYLFCGSSILGGLINCQLGPACIEVNLSSWNDYKSCAYDGINFSNLPPLDQKTLHEFVHCEVIFLKMADRLLPGSTYQQRKDQYIRHLRFWMWKIPLELDLAIFHNTPHQGFDFIIYFICKTRNIKTLSFYNLPIRPNKVYLMHSMADIFSSGQEIRKTYLKLKADLNPNGISVDCLSPSLRHYFDEYSKAGNKILSFTRATSKKKAIDEVLRVGEKIIKYLIGFKLNQLTIKSFQYIALRTLSESFMAKLTGKPSYYESEQEVKKYYQRHSIVPDLTVPYIYFPLHYQPECSTSPLGDEYVHQYLVCEMLAYAASFYNISVYVKEHPRASKSAYIRNVSFYKKMLDCKNVMFVEKSVSSFELIDNSVAIATVSGSAGWEAVLRLKPVLLFGSRFYESAPGVFRIAGNLDLSNALDLIVNKRITLLQLDLIIYLKALESHVFEAFIDQGDAVIATVSNEVSNQNFINKILNYVNSVDFCAKQELQ